MNSSHFAHQLKEAIELGFTHHFQITQHGLLKCLATNKLYSVEDVIVCIHSCTGCRSTFYLVKTNDGLRGTAFETWDL